MPPGLRKVFGRCSGPHGIPTPGTATTTLMPQETLALLPSDTAKRPGPRPTASKIPGAGHCHQESRSWAPPPRFQELGTATKSPGAGYCLKESRHWAPPPRFQELGTATKIPGAGHLHRDSRSWAPPPRFQELGTSSKFPGAGHCHQESRSWAPPQRVQELGTAARSPDPRRRCCSHHPAVKYILNRCEYKRGSPNKFGITKLLDSKTYSAAYTLHDCKFNQKSSDPLCPNERYLLYEEWGHPKNFYKLQPLDLIRYYFQEVCDPEIGGRMIMCPQCDRDCTYWRLNVTCESSRKLSIFDNYGTLAYAVFMGIWVTVFLEFWKRRQATLEYEWDTVELEQEEPRRPEYEAKCTIPKKNPITQEEELVPYTACGKCMRLVCGGSTVLFWISLIIATVIAIIVYRLAAFFNFSAKLPEAIDENLEPLKDYLTPQMATSVTASLINFLFIMILNILYEKVAIWITDFELPRTQTDYENSLTVKMFLFQFVNYYSSCFYIAFFKGKIVGYPGGPVYWLGRFRNEECDPGGCLIELSTQLLIIMGGKAIWNNVQEVLIPWLKNLIARCREKSEEKLPRWEQDYQLQSISKLGLFYEYLEMVIQFGFATIFVASFPLAPLLALINNIIEIRVDGWKMTTQFRRILAVKAQDIGAWLPILHGVAVFAAVTNALIIAFTSDMIPRLVYYWALSMQPFGAHNSPTMQGYINTTLSVFRVADFKNLSKPRIVPSWFDHETDTTCRYRDLRYPPGHPLEYNHSLYFWHVMAAKLAFIIIMEHVVFTVSFLVSYCIPDVPKHIKEQIKRERYLTQKLLHESQLTDWHNKMAENANTIMKGPMSMKSADMDV
ncbi:anoctamin-6-like [Rhincodon typus]|uniref:anoctamin-6-like n=1 Tax=Rhincodon typus TaxID=259920 RepID=UPI0020309B07|nr:anoctamin-6-like [Rhincodon typus]